MTTQRIRIQMTHAPGSKAGLTEVKVYHRGGGGPDPDPPTNLALSATPSASYTSPWESVAAINDGIDPPSSNDTVNPRWGTWPNEGEQWAELTWSSAVSLNRAEVYTVNTTRLRVVLQSAADSVGLLEVKAYGP